MLPDNPTVPYLPPCIWIIVCLILVRPVGNWTLVSSLYGMELLLHQGWTTWAVGSATCTGENCVNIVALAPLVPIAPDIRKVGNQHVALKKLLLLPPPPSVPPLPQTIPIVGKLNIVNCICVAHVLHLALALAF